DIFIRHFQKLLPAIAIFVGRSGIYLYKPHIFIVIYPQWVRIRFKKLPVIFFRPGKLMLLFFNFYIQDDRYNEDENQIVQLSERVLLAWCQVPGKKGNDRVTEQSPAYAY